jgi:hypothetical protein
MRRAIFLSACFALYGCLGQQLADKFQGVWTNVNPLTDGITRIEIRSEGESLLIHVWGKCHPQDCDWGEMATTGDEALRRVHWNRSMPIRTKTSLSALTGG